MKHFIKHTLLFLVLVALVFTAIYTFFSYQHTFTPNVEYNSKEFDTAFDSGDYDLVAIGNSKVMVSIDKTLLEKELELRATILAYGSTDISISKLTLEAYLNKAVKKPDYVLLEVSWFTFNPRRTHFSSLSGDLFLEDYRLWKHLYQHRPKSAHNLRDVLYTKTRAYFLGKQDNNTPWIVKSLQRRPKQADSIKIKTPYFNTKAFEKVFPDHKAGIDPVLYKDYKAILEMCKQNNIQLILYTAPESTVFADLQADRDAIYSIYNNTAQDVVGVSYLNYAPGGAFYKKSYENWLGDSHHIKNTTAFTRVFVADIKKEVFGK